MSPLPKWVAALLWIVTLTRSSVAHEDPASQQVFSNSQYKDGSQLVQPVYKTLPLGTIRPHGWFRDQLLLEADGLAGNMFDFYRFVHDSRWIGGRTEYSALDEASPYWFNGLVPLAFALRGDAEANPDNDTVSTVAAATRIQAQVRHYLDYVLEHQQSDGWLGFEKTHQTRGLWARCLLLLGLMQYAEADPSQTDRIVDAMHRYVVLAHSMLRNNYTGLLVHGNDVFDTAGFGVGRTHEMHIPLQWLYERYPRNNSQVLWETMEMMVDGGVLWGADWRRFWVDGVYPPVLNDAYSLSWVFIHGVNMAEGLRYPLAIYRMTRDDRLKRQTRTALDLLARYHKSLAGTIVADEYIADLNPARGAELCTAAEMMFSTAWIYQYLGDNDVADWAEQTAFNALPAAIAPDWWSHQYVQQENQPWSRNLTKGAGLWTDVNSYSNVFGLEPNYPCCTVNHPQAYPKFLANSFVLTEDGGIAHVFLIGGRFNTILGDGNNVSVHVDTKYPFEFDLTYTVTATKPLSFYVRIPTWVNVSSSTISTSSANTTKPISPSQDRGLHKVDIPAASGEPTTFTVHLDTQPRVVNRPNARESSNKNNNTAAVYYGPLLYSLAIEYKETEGPPRNYANENAFLPNSTTHAHAHDHVLEPTSVWNVAIDPTQMRVVHRRQRPDSDAAEPLPNPIWTLGAPPVELRIAAVEIDWPLAYDSPASPPVHPQRAKGKDTKPFSARFVPYGSAKLHMAQLPVLALEKVDLE